MPMNTTGENKLPSTEDGQNKKFKMAKWFILLLVFHFLCGSLFLGSVRLGTHEQLAAERAREMVSHGNWVVPYLNGKPSFLKPPLGFWQSAIFAKFFNSGHLDEWAARMPTVLSAVALTAMIVLFVKSFASQQTALLAGFMFAASTTGLVWGRRAEVDLQLASWTAAALLCFFQSFNSENPRKSLRWARASWLMLALAILCKGPLPIAQMLIVMITMYIATKRKPGIIALASTIIGVAILSAVLLPWVVSMYKSYPIIFKVWNNQIFGRLVTSSDGELETGHPKQLWFYLLRIWGLFAPWIIPVITGLWHGFKGRLNIDRKRWIFLLAWSLGSMVLMSLASAKRVRYAVVFVVPFFIIAALGMQYVWQNRQQYYKWIRPVVLLHMLVVPAGVVTGIVLAFMYSQIAVASIFVGIIVPAGAVIAYRYFRREKVFECFVALAVTFAIALPVTHATIAPHFENMSKNTGVPIGRYIHNEKLDIENITFYRATNMGVVFYAQSPINEINKPDSLPKWLSERTGGYIITKDTRGLNEIKELAEIQAVDFFAPEDVRPKHIRYKLWQITQIDAVAVKNALIEIENNKADNNE